MDTMQTERKYALMKIETGDYLLPSNDLRCLWRIKRGTELFAAYDGSEEERDGWHLWRWTVGSFEVAKHRTPDPFDWGEWECYGFFGSRAEAIADSVETT